VPYATGRSLDVYRPRSAAGAVPVVVLVHGCCGDRSDLVKLAEATAAAGALVLNADWAGLAADARYPGAYEDVACAVRYARAAAGRYGGDPARVTLVGWSDGALVAAVVALAGEHLDAGRCRAAATSPRPDALVGVGGYYGWRAPVPARLVGPRTVRFLGGTPATAAQAWRDATPYGWLRSTGRPVRTTLLVGEQDPLRADAAAFAAALRRAGHRVMLVVAPPAGDQSMISPRTAEGRTTVREILAAAG
jgi:acetyl esterase